MANHNIMNHKWDLSEIQQLFNQGLSKQEVIVKIGINKSSLNRYIAEFNMKAPKYVQTSETKQKRSSSLKRAHKNDPQLSGRKTKAIVKRASGNKGKTFDEIFGREVASQLKANLSVTHTGKKHSAETIRKMSKTRKGRKFSLSHRNSISKSRKKGLLDGTIVISSRAGCGKGGYKKDIGHYVRSTYEHYFAQQLQRNKTEYFYEHKRFSLLVENKQATFIPDFYLIEEKKWIEIKNTYNAQDEKFLKKLAAFRIAYPNENIEVIVGDRGWVPNLPQNHHRSS